MQNETKISPEKIKSLLSMLTAGNRDSAEKLISSSLDENQKRKINSIISDPQKLKELLSSPQAKELMKKFGAQGENGNGSP